MKRTVLLAATLFALAAFSPPASALVRGKPVSALALYGEPKYGPDFAGIDWINPAAP